MKIKRITLKNYKVFLKEKTFYFTDSDGEINEQTLIVGDNGSGKTSVLQAIVILLASAIRHTEQRNSQSETLTGPYRKLPYWKKKAIHVIHTEILLKTICLIMNYFIVLLKKTILEKNIKIYRNSEMSWNQS